MNFKKFWTGWIVIVAGAFRLASQIIILPVEHVMVNAAPLQMEINAMLLDSRGFLWVGYQDGLARYDGYGVVPCLLDEAQKPAAADASVRGLCEDPGGRLWLATARGLVRYDPASGTAVRFRSDPERSDTLSDDDITCLYVSPALPGRMWIASAGGALDELDLASGHIARHPPAAAGPGMPLPGRIHVITGDPAGFLWIGAAAGLYRFQPLDGRLQFCPPPAAVSGVQKPFGVRSILCDPAFPDTLWIGSDGAGLFRYFPAAGRWQRGSEAGAFGELAADATINTLAPFPGDPQYLIFGTEDGLYRFDLISGRFRHVGMFFNNSDYQASLCTRVIYHDPGGNYWFGSCHNGLDKWSPLQKKFPSFRPYLKDLPSPLANWVTSLRDLGNDSFLLSTYGGGVFTFDRRTGEFKRQLLDPGQPGRVLNSFVTDSRVDRDGSLWFTTNEGLAHCSASGRLQRLYPYAASKSETGNILVFQVIRDSGGTIWLASHQGVMRLDPASGKLRVDRHDRNDPRSLSNNRVNVILEDRDGSIWIGTDDGLNLYQPRDERYRIFRNDSADPATLSNNLVYYLTQDSLGRIWVGTANGLNLLRRQGEKVTFQRFLVSGGEPNQNYVLSLVEENSRYFWLGSKVGLTRFDSRQGTFTFYDRRDGVDGNSMNDAYLGFRSRDGEIIFGGRWGFTSFRPSGFALNPHPPPVVMTGLQTGMEGAVPPSSRLPRQPLVFTAAEKLNSLAIEFAALDFFRPERNQYAYRLEGRDRDWIYQGRDRVVRLSGLKPGRYSLRVKAANNDGIWNENGLAVAIVIRRPFWSVWGLPLLAALALMALAAAVAGSRRRVRRLRAAALPDNLDLVLEKFAISRREAEIVRLLLAGKSNKEIEDALFIAMSTVKIHVHNIFQKTNVNSRVKLLLRIQQEAKKLKS